MPKKTPALIKAEARITELEALLQNKDNELKVLEELVVEADQKIEASDDQQEKTNLLNLFLAKNIEEKDQKIIELNAQNAKLAHVVTVLKATTRAAVGKMPPGTRDDWMRDMIDIL